MPPATAWAEGRQFNGAPSPGSGARRSTLAGVSESFNGVPVILTGPYVGCSSSTNISLACTCGSATISATNPYATGQYAALREYGLPLAFPYRYEHRGQGIVVR